MGDAPMNGKVITKLGNRVGWAKPAISNVSL